MTVIDWHSMVQSFLIYARLVIYPFLAYSLIIYAYGPLYERNKEESKLLAFLAIVFVLLWGSSIIFSITRNNEFVVMYNSIGLVPWLFFLLIYIWILVWREAKRQKKEKENADNLYHRPTGSLDSHIR